MVSVKRVHMYFIRNPYPLSSGKSLTSNNAIRLGSILMPLFPHDPTDILKYTDDLHNLNVYVWTSLKHVLRIKTPTFIHKTKLSVNMYVNNYGTNRYLQKFWQLYKKTLMQSINYAAKIVFIWVLFYWRSLEEQQPMGDTCSSE